MAVHDGGGNSVLARAAAGLPGVGSFGVLAGVDPSSLSPSDLVDAVITAERLLAQVHAVQSSLLAELGRPQRCGDVSGLVAALVGRAGAGRGADGSVDVAAVAELTAERSIGLAATEVAAVLDWSPMTARIRITQAQRLESALPKTLAALRAGRVDVGRVRMILERTAVLSPELCRRIEGRILGWVKGRSKGRLETLVDREVVMADPAAAELRRLAAVTGRNVSHRVDKDGMGVINALLPAEAAVMVFTLVDLIAQANKGLDGRSVDQRRADAIADIADQLLTFGFVDLHGLIATAESAAAGSAAAGSAAAADTGAPTGADNATGGGAATGEADEADERVNPAAGAAAHHAAAAADERANPAAGTAPAEPEAPPAPGVGDADRAARLGRAMSRHGRRPHLNVTGAWTTLAGLDELPGHLDGHGVITAQLLRKIAASWGSVTAVGVDPATGTATTIGATTYRPSQALGDQVILLSGTCRMAGCAIPAWRCDIDHLEPFDHHHRAAGGSTSLCNTVPLCKFHHLLKHHTAWTPTLQADLSIRWTTNTGHQATSHPREFTLPGEWDRPTPDHPDPGDNPARGRKPVDLAPDKSQGNSARNGNRADVDGGPSDEASMTGVTGVIYGPTVSGPTIPVIPAGHIWIEPNTELEDPDTIPDPGSAQIRTYRILRQQAREHSLRRLAGLRRCFDPAEQRTRDFINGRTHDTQGNPLHAADFDAATQETARITQNLAIAALVERSRRPRTA